MPRLLGVYSVGRIVNPVSVVPGASPSSVQMLGGYYTDNGLGIAFGDGPSARASRISAKTVVKGNVGHADFAINDGLVGSDAKNNCRPTTAPPSSGTLVTNPFPSS